MMIWDDAHDKTLDSKYRAKAATSTGLRQRRLPKPVVELLEISLFALFVCRYLSALDQNRTIHQFVHTRWTQQDGLPPALECIAQTTDGYIWLAGGDGIFRFDGVRFERYQAPSGEKLLSNYISTLMAVPGGGLWVGYQFGGASFIKEGQLTNYAEREGLLSTSVTHFARDGEGVIWAATGLGLMRLEGSHWRKVQKDWDYPRDNARVLFTDQQGMLWVATPGESLMFLPRGARKFRSTEVRVADVVSFSQTSDGTLLLSTDGMIRRLSLGDRGWHVEDPGVKAEPVSTLVDRNGVFWAATLRDGLLRVRNPAEIFRGITPRSSEAIEHYTDKDGLTDNRISVIVEDLEGDIWAVNDKGLDRFHEATVMQVSIPSAIDVVTIVTNSQGELFAGSGESFSRLQNGALIAMDGAPKSILCAYLDPTGAIWLGGKGVLWHFSQNKFVSIALPAVVTGHDIVQAMTMDSAGRLWTSITHNGTFRLAGNGVWEHFGGQLGLPELTAITEITDSAGRIWFGYTGARIAMLDGGKVHTFSSADGLTTGNVTALHEAHGKIWAGGEHGLEYFTGSRFEPLRTQDKDLFRNISGIIETSIGDLWLNQTSGIVHIEDSEIRAAISNPDHPVQYEQFNYLDGYLDSPLAIRPLPTAIEGAADRLWFATDSRLFWIDPNRIHRNPNAPPVSIEALIADGKGYRALNQSGLPPNVQNIEIDYTALDLSIPERVRFRYRLEGVDKNWLSVGTRRQAYYTKLRPGIYKFHVIACNSNGVWNNVGAELDFYIAPAFNQTAWFRALLGFLAAGFLWMLYSLRLRQATSQIQGRLEERLSERERIARELHDTLLQGFQGLMLRLQAVMNRIPDHDQAHHMMEEVLKHADEVLIEGRGRVEMLRGEDETMNELSEVLAHYGRQTAEQHPAVFGINVTGSPRSLNPVVRDEAYRIGREALANAFQHSRASKIEVEITYDRTIFRLKIRDDGISIKEEFLDNGRPGHWGLPGMRERAQRTGGRFEIWSRAGVGTEISLSFPSKLAYQHRRKKLSWPWKKRLGPSEKEQR